MICSSNFLRYTNAKNTESRAFSYEPGQPGWLGFRDLALRLFSFQKFHMSSYEKAGRPGYRDLGFCDRDLGKRLKIFLYEHHSPVTELKLETSRLVHLGNG